MPDLTSNYSFKKPKANEYVKPNDFNDNWDALDEKLKNIEENAASESAPLKHTHNASDINAGTLDSARLPKVPVDKGGTGATTAEGARVNLGAASEDHSHTPESIGAAAANHTHTPESIGAAPAYTYGTTDLTAGSSPLATGTLYFVYE